MSQAARLSIAAAVLTMGATAARADGTTASASASVEITSLQQIQIDKVADIAFGQIVKPTAGTYTVTLAPGGARTASGGTGGQLVGGSVSTGKFDVTGEGGRTFSITVPSTVTLATSGGGANREVVLTPDPMTSESLGGSAGQAAVKQIEVAGRLAVPASIEAGAYAGAFPVTVGYQ
jgi:hypothetical protein